MNRFKNFYNPIWQWIIFYSFAEWILVWWIVCEPWNENPSQIANSKKKKFEPYFEGNMNWSNEMHVQCRKDE